MKRKGIEITEFLLMLGIVVLINIIASQYFFRVDLTEDKRYTISNTSKSILKNLDDVVVVQVFLTGELPGGFKRLESSVKETLDEFRAYGGPKVQYTFTDPFDESVSKDMQNRFLRQIAAKGIQPTEITNKTKKGTVRKLVCPGALISYKEKETAVMFLKGNTTANSEEILNQSVEGVEFQLISGIRQLVMKDRKSVAFVEGHGEFPPQNLTDIASSLGKYYDVYRVNLSEVKELDNYNGLIIARPRSGFSEKEKLLLDQYVMKGGKVLFFLDQMRAELDSITDNGFISFPYEHNLNDLLFKYGVRVNNNLVKDLNSGVIGITTGKVDDKPKIEYFPWPYYPLINTFGNHPAVKNLDVIYTKFVSSIDTVKANGVTKIPVAFTSKYSKAFASPVMISFNEVRKDTMDPRAFNQGPQPIAYLLEGRFTSLYRNRPLPEQINDFRAEGQQTRILVCADADIIKNEVDERGTEIPLGYDKISRRIFGNKDFVTNCVDYLMDDKGIIDVRAKEITIRPLDRVEASEESLYWQVLNIVVPVLLILLFGVIRFYLRKKHFESFK